MWEDMLVWLRFTSVIYILHGSGEFVHVKDVFGAVYVDRYWQMFA